MTDNYRYIIDSISAGNNNHGLATSGLTVNVAIELMKEVVAYLGLRDMHPERQPMERCYESKKHFVYFAKFPHLHIAIDNHAGTTRKYSITTVDELKKVPR